MTFHARQIRSLWLAVAALVAAATLAGCSQSEQSGPSTTLSITSGFGASDVQPEQTVPATSGLTVMRQLQQSADVEATYGGRFVNSIDGLKGGGGNDWLYFVDGIESEIAANDWRLKGGEIVQWDYHAWQDVKSGGAIVGAFPQPLRGRGVQLNCVPAKAVHCDTVTGALDAEQIKTDASGESAVTVVVGQWNDIKDESGVPDLTALAADNGAFASFSRDGNELTVVDDRGQEVETFDNGAGLIAALREGGRLVWLVTGVDEQGVLNAASALSIDELKNRFAVAVTLQGSLPLPRLRVTDDAVGRSAAP